MRPSAADDAGQREGCGGSAVLAPAEVDFDGGRPVSRRFGDIYYDADGAAEALRVFIGPARVRERAGDGAATFTIAEFGFGAGLNFLAAAGETRARLHFLSFERHPLARADLARALAPWRRAYPLADALLAGYPPPLAGWHRRSFDAGRVQLSLYLGDVADGLRALGAQQRRGIDAWFLDGFAPQRNPAMWREELFQAMAALSAPGATATSFTAAGHVRRALAANGFAVRRIDHRRGAEPGAAVRKRHSTAAVFQGAGRCFRAPARVRVIGAGMAGAATARALAEKGIAATLRHRGEGVAAAASAIPAALLHARLLPGGSAEARSRSHGYAFAASRCRGLPGTRATGALQLPSGRALPQRLQAAAAAVPRELAHWLDADAVAARAGLNLGAPGVFFPGALAIAGRPFAQALAQHPAIDCRAARAEAEDEKDDDADAPRVWATGAEAGGFAFLEVRPLGGQIDRFPCAQAPAVPIAADGVAIPDGGALWVGATYEHAPWPAQRATAANAARFAKLCGASPSGWLERFRGMRAATSDRAPVIGFDGGDWFNLGHGAHGTVTGVLGAEIVASALNGEVAPVCEDILKLFAPGRFRARQARRGRWQ